MIRKGYFEDSVTTIGPELSVSNGQKYSNWYNPEEVNSAIPYMFTQN